MSSGFAIRLVFSLLMSAAVTWSIWQGGEDETSACETEKPARERYRPMIAATLLPCTFLFILVLLLAFSDAKSTLRLMLGVCLNLFLQIGLYDIVLLILMPFLRKHISARTCALLWLLPTYLYIMFHSGWEAARPLLVLRTSGYWVWAVFAVWLLGFAAVFMWKTLTHFIFRRRILRQSVPITDEAVLAVWQKEIKAAGIKKARFRLVISSAVTSPLTIGLFRVTMRVVLPQRDYTPDELHLVFRHELIHICRADSTAKFYQVFCTAMCWFNPLMWRAMRSSAEDMELSCDETVLLEADAATRRAYAELLLSAAGDERGYTTCLSAVASSMRYRLQSVLKPRKRRTGAIVAGTLMLALLLSGGYAALSYGGQSGETVLFGGESETYTLNNSRLKYCDGSSSQLTCVDESGLRDYLSGLNFETLTGTYGFDNCEKVLILYYQSADGWIEMELSTHMALLRNPFEGRSSKEYYYLAEGVDWSYLDTVLIDAQMDVHLSSEESVYGWDITVNPDRISRVTENDLQPVYDAGRADGESPSGIFGPEPENVTLCFACPLTEPPTVTVSCRNESEPRHFTWEETGQKYLLNVSWETDARYTLTASLLAPDGGVYRAEYVFDVGEVQ